MTIEHIQAYREAVARRQAMEREVRRFRIIKLAVIGAAIATILALLGLMLAPALLEMVGDSLEVKL